MLERTATTTKAHNIPFTGLGETGGSIVSGPLSVSEPSGSGLVLSGKLLLAKIGEVSCFFSSRMGRGIELADMVV